jgi:hypothetical protein
MPPAGADTDRTVHRMERDAVLASAGMAVVAFVARGGRPDVALGVLGGAALIAGSYLAIKGGVNAVVGAAIRTSAAPLSAPSFQPAPSGGGDAPAGVEEGTPAGAATGALGRGRRVLLLVNFLIRYALLGLGAYVMLVRLRLHPVGLAAGVSSPVIAAGVELLRQLRRLSRAGHSR